MGQQSCSSEELAFAGADLQESFFSSVSISIRVLIPYPAFPQKISPTEKSSETSFGSASSIFCWHSEFPYRVVSTGCLNSENPLCPCPTFKTPVPQPNCIGCVNNTSNRLY